MKHVLFVNACPRREASRTRQLAEAFLAELAAQSSDIQVIEQDLTVMGLKPVDSDALTIKEALCDRQAWDHPSLAPALAFQQADAVVIAAPYWDLSFPSILKIWVENVYVRHLTFRYEKDKPIGLCRGVESVYITTSGSYIGGHDWGAAYMRAVLTTLGIPGFTAIRAEALDLDDSDSEAILREAMKHARREAQALAGRLGAS